MRFCNLFILIAVLLSAAPSAQSAVYYIDYENGDDKAAGTSARKAWKHAPGDSNAQDKAKAVQLQAGDTVLFKGGVAYRGSIELAVSGAEGKRIRLDGNSEGKFGDGPAIMDGGTIINNWQKCKSKEDAKGNKLWKDIFYADVDLDISANFNHGQFVSHRQVPQDKMAPWQRVILCDGAKRLLPIAQYPKPKDNFYPDKPGDFQESPQRLSNNKAEGITTFADAENLKQDDAEFFEGMQIGVHGGNNHVYFASIKSFDPATKKFTLPIFKPKTYPKTKYALYNSPRLMSEKGEWAVEPIDGGKTRFYLLPDDLVKGKPSNIGFPVLQTCFKLKDGASHYEIDGFLIQRYSGGDGAVAIMRHSKRSKDVHVSNLEIRFLTGHAGIGPHHCDHIVIDNCYIHHCPGWTTAVFMNRVNDYKISNCFLIKNSGSGIRHYESKRGHIHDNEVLDHYGMHSSTLNMYEGCDDVLVENNFLNNIITINRNANKLVFRNNVVDSEGKSGINLAIWGSGRTGGRNVSNLLIENNTFINRNEANSWGASIFVQGKASKPTGMVVRNNVFDLIKPMSAEISGNVYIKQVDAKAMGEGSQVEGDYSKLFQAPDKEDYRRKKGSVLEDAGAKLGPPKRTWKRK